MADVELKSNLVVLLAGAGTGSNYEEYIECKLAGIWLVHLRKVLTVRILMRMDVSWRGQYC